MAEASEGETAVPAQARAVLNAAVDRDNERVKREHAEAEIWRLRAELRATEGDLGVAVQVAAERADQISSLRKMMAVETVQDGHLRTYADEIVRLEGEIARRQRAETFHFDRANRLSAQRQAVLDLCVAWEMAAADSMRGQFASEAILREYTEAVATVPVSAILAAVGAATGTKGDPTDVRC